MSAEQLHVRFEWLNWLIDLPFLPQGLNRSIWPTNENIGVFGEIKKNTVALFGVLNFTFNTNGSDNQTRFIIIIMREQSELKNLYQYTKTLVQFSLQFLVFASKRLEKFHQNLKLKNSL